MSDGREMFFRLRLNRARELQHKVSVFRVPVSLTLLSINYSVLDFNVAIAKSTKTVSTVR